jgi:hypothetical protein
VSGEPSVVNNGFKTKDTLFSDANYISSYVEPAASSGLNVPISG